MTEQLKPMTPFRAAALLRRFKHDEQMLGPNEQAAIDFAISAITALTTSQPAQAGEVDERVLVKGVKVNALHRECATFDLKDRCYACQALESFLPTQPADHCAGCGLLVSAETVMNCKTPSRCGTTLKTTQPAAQATPEPSHGMIGAAMGGYLRRSRSGGMSRKQSDLVQFLVDDAERLGYFKIAIASAIAQASASLPPQQAAGEPIGYVSPEALEELHMSGEPASIHPWQDRDDFVAVYTHPAPGVPEDVQHEIAAALALFPINISGQSFVVSGFNNNKPLEADGDTVFFSQKKVYELLTELRDRLAAAQAKGGEHA